MKDRNASIIPFKNIISVSNCDKGKNETLFRWSFNFILETRERTFELFAASEDERQLWIHDLQRIADANANGTSQMAMMPKKLETSVDIVSNQIDSGLNTNRTNLKTNKNQSKSPVGFDYAQDDQPSPSKTLTQNTLGDIPDIVRKVKKPPIQISK